MDASENPVMKEVLEYLKDKYYCPEMDFRIIIYEGENYVHEEDLIQYLNVTSKLFNIVNPQIEIILQNMIKNIKGMDQR